MEQGEWIRGARYAILIMLGGDIPNTCIGTGLRVNASAKAEKVIGIYSGYTPHAGCHVSQRKAAAQKVRIYYLVSP